MARVAGQENRRTARVAVSRGLWVAWQSDGPRHVSRVRDLSAGGAFIQTPLALPMGAAIEMLFALPEGETRIEGVVRYADGKTGAGVEFTAMSSSDRARLNALLRRLNKR